MAESRAVSALEITNVFADDTTQKVTINDIEPNNINGATAINRIRQTVMNFNAQSGGTLTTKMKSKNGFNWIGIKRVRIITKDTNYIF